MTKRISNINAKKAVIKKFYQSEKAISLYDDMILKIDENIKDIEKEIIALIEKYPEFRQTFSNVTSITGVGKVLAFHLITVTNGFTEHLDFKKLSSYLGIVPTPYQSGSWSSKKILLVV
jgi:transposase